MRGGALLSQLASEAWAAFRAQFTTTRDGALLSAALHVTVILVFVFGLPQFTDPPTETLIPVELVMLDEEEPPEPEPEPEPAPKAVPTPPEPEPPVQEARVEPEPEPEPPTPEPEPDPVPEPLAKAEPETPVVPTPPKPKRRPDIKVVMPDEHAHKKEDALTSILRNVEKLRDKPRPRREQIASADANADMRQQVSSLEQNQMVRAIQDQLRRCWRLDPGARGAEDMVIEIRVLLNPDGSVRKTEILDVVRMVQDAYFRSAAENAKRAINMCSPFQLPPRKYQAWRELTLRFNPKEMFGT